MPRSRVALDHVLGRVEPQSFGSSSRAILYTDGGFADVTDEWADWKTPNLE